MNTIEKITAINDLKQHYLPFYMKSAFIKLFKGTNWIKDRKYISFGTIFSTGCKIWELAFTDIKLIKVTMRSDVYKLFFLKPHISNHLLFETRT